MNKTVSTPSDAPQIWASCPIPVATPALSYLGAPFVAISGAEGRGAVAYGRTSTP
jgi:hypothetical protein